jgi:CRP-like cAMP-binding protein
LYLQQKEKTLKKYTSFLVNCPLFEKISLGDLEGLLVCLQARAKSYKKDSSIFTAGEEIRSVGILLSGEVHILEYDFWGNRSIVTRIESGELFGEAFACAEVKSSPVTVTAVEDSEVLFIDYKKTVTACPSACKFHTRLIQNMLKIVAQKNIMLLKKLEHISRRTTREKLLSYLSFQALRGKSASFDLRFNRQELADYLSIDRSAMAAELGRMSADGIISFHKNHFELLKKAPGSKA